jgi:Cu2+-exporting ATPase
MHQGGTMKTSVIEVHDMLTVLSVDEVEKRIGEVPGVDSVTVNFAAGSATTRYDETRLEVADIKSAVRQRGYESAEPAAVPSDDGHKGHTALGGQPATQAPTVSKAAPAITDAASAIPAQQEKATPPSTTPNSSPTALAAPAAPATPAAGPAADNQQNKTTSDNP